MMTTTETQTMKRNHEREQKLLATIDAEPGLTFNELARRIKARLDLTIKSLKTLECEGLIESRPDEDPRKVPHWFVKLS